MKKLYGLIILSALAILSGCISTKEETPSYSINADIEGIENGEAKLMYLNLTNNESVIVDSTEVTNGQFVFRGQVDHPYFYTIKINDSIGAYFFLENSEIALSGSKDSIIVSGSAEDSLLSSYVFSDIFRKDVGLEIMLNHNDTHVAAFTAFYQFQTNPYSVDTLEMIMNGFSPEVKQSEYYAQLDSLYQTMKNVAIGRTAPDFSIPNTKGQSIQLSDYRGDYILLDFWASWCAPCRKEMPDLLSIYHQYRDKGFKVIAISVDKDRKRWMKAITDDQLDWINLSNCAGWDNKSKSYGIKSIPQNFLIDPDGVIIGKNLSKETLRSELEAVY